MIEIPQQLFDEAVELNWAIYNNWKSNNGNDIWEEVIVWADKWIELLDKWPDEITEISLNGRRKDSSARACLAALAKQGSIDPMALAEKALLWLEQGRSPFHVVSDLYPLVHDTFSTGGLEFELTVPEPLRKAIYQMDYDSEAVDPVYGWADVRGEEAEGWLREEMQKHLTNALTEIKSDQL